MVTRLYNSRGEHIANMVNQHLHAPSGSNIGHYLEQQRIFIDMRGRYLGEIMADDRLLVRKSSPHRNTNFGVRGNAGNVGNYGNPGRRGNMAMPAGYEDVDRPQRG